MQDMQLAMAGIQLNIVTSNISLMGVFQRTGSEFQDIKGWINSGELTLNKLRGKTVLLDFWTYSCINCIRSLPHIKALYERFKKNKFLVIGIHTPEFEFEKKIQNVKDAVIRLGIKYPVAIDSDNTTWKLYGNRYWPRSTLIDAEGKIRYEHIGEGGYQDIEYQIEKLLMENGEKILESKIPVTSEQVRALTPEIYLGSNRSRGFGSSSVCIKGSCYRHVDSGRHANDVVYLSGDWIQYDECVKHEGDKGYIALKYTAKVANAVMSSFGHAAKAVVKLNDNYLTLENAGKNIKFSGKISYVLIGHPDMYELVRTNSSQTNEVKIEVDSKNFAMYSFTFG